MVLSDLLSAHGYWLVAAVITLESMGIPLPGETTLVTAAVYAGTTHHLKIGFVIAAAAIGAIVGDNAGFWVGRRFGVGLLHRYGHLVRLDRKRISLGQHLFERHGGKVVFFGRFVAVLRTLAALLAGVNGMEVRRFLIFNAAGGIVWATVYGVAAYVFGEQIERLHGPLATVGLAVAVIAVVLGLWIARRHEQVLAAHADRGGSV
jgi:membrane protein DedA with SNARE-associated domain